MNEAYLKLVDQTHATWQNRAQFLGVAAGLMRRILVDRARSAGRVSVVVPTLNTYRSTKASSVLKRNPGRLSPSTRHWRV